MKSKLWGRQHQCASFPGWSIVSWRWAHCQQTHTDSWRPSGKISQVCKHYTHWLGSNDLVHTTQQYKLIWCIMCVHTINSDISTCCVCCAQVWCFDIKRYGTFYNTGMILWYIKVWYFGVYIYRYGTLINSSSKKSQNLIIINICLLQSKPVILQHSFSCLLIPNHTFLYNQTLHKMQKT